LQLAQKLFPPEQCCSAAVAAEVERKEQHMSEMIPFGGGLAKRDSRAVRAELSRLDAHGRVELARINQQADLQAERIAAVGYVGKRAMHEVAMLSQLEVQLCTVVPAATGRLQGMGDLAALVMADVVTETVRRVK
jgi:hypothetical protein